MKFALLPAGLLLALSSAAFAQEEVTEEEEFKPWLATAAFVSDYRFRGVSQTINDPAILLALNYYTPSGFYAGGFLGNVDFPADDGASTEVDLYVGWTGALSEDVTADVSFVSYIYPHDEADLNFNELVGKVTYSGLTGTVAYSNDAFALGETGIYYNLAYGLKVAEEYDVTANIGYWDLDDVFGGNITDYSVGVSRSFGPLIVGLSYVDTNGALDEVFGGLSSGRFVFSLGTALRF